MPSGSATALLLQKSLKQVDFKIFGGKNMSECNYTGNKTKNYFTAYLQKCIQWKRQRFLKKEESINIKEKALEEISQTKYGDRKSVV